MKTTTIKEMLAVREEIVGLINVNSTLNIHAQSNAEEELRSALVAAAMDNTLNKITQILGLTVVDAEEFEIGQEEE